MYLPLSNLIIRSIDSSEYSIPFTKRIALKAVKFLNKKYNDYELLADMVSIAHRNKYYRFYTSENTNLKC